MSTATCPTCEASMTWTEASRSDPPACPFCGARVEAQDFSLPGDLQEPVEAGGEERSRETDTRKIQIVEQSADRLLLAIAAAGRGAMSIAAFAVLWNAVSWTVGVALIVSGALGQMGPLSVIPFLMIGLFLAIGVFLIAWALNSMFGRALVLVERERASVQKIFFGWKRTKSVELSPASLAALEEAYRQNDVPVYRIKISGPNGIVRFGTALPHADKIWTVATVNGFLAPEAAGELIAKPEPLNDFETLWRSAANAAAVEPTNLSEGSLVGIDASSDDRLEISVPLLPKRIGFVSASIVFIGLSLMVGFVWSAGFGDLGDASIVFLLPFVLVVLLQVLACVAIFRGRITVQVDAQKILVWWHLGPVGPSKSLPTSSVERVAVMASGEAMRHLAVVAGGSTAIPLTTFHDRTTDEEVAGLVRWQLERLGHTLR